MDILNEYLVILQQFLVGLGVPEAQGALAALGLIYLLLTLLLLLFILLLVVRSRGRRAVKRAARQVVEAETEAETVEAPADMGVAEPEAVVAEVEPDVEPEPAAAPVEEPAVTPEVPSETPEPAVVSAPEETPAPVSMFERLRLGLNKTRSSLVGRVDALIGSHAKLDDEFIEELEEILITADFGMQATQELVADLTRKAASLKADGADALRDVLAEEIRARLNSGEPGITPGTQAPFVIMVVGVNGVGKTTTIGKLARQFANDGKKVVLGAGDTFRAAAVQQLQVWGERSGVDVIAHTEGSDPSAVAFDAAKAAVARQADILILDTAGRLHTKVNLMEELSKMRRVLDREIPGAPHETLLVLDATTGQNALIQATKFQDAVDVSGVALTKLDGTAKGGIVVAISSQLQLPVRYIGVGEGVDDLRPFDADEFVEALFSG